MPRKQTQFDRESATNYLAERHLLTKSPKEYTTPYLIRLATAARTQEQAGKEFSRVAARGHAREPLVHLPAKGHRYEQWQLRNPNYFDPQAAALDAVDVRRLTKKGGADTNGIYTYVFKGVTKDPSPTDPKWEPDKPSTYSFNVNKASVNRWLKENKNGTALEFVNRFYRHSPVTELVMLGVKA